MVKARREIEQNLKVVDIVIMLLDARAPLACRNPELEQMIRQKSLILVLNKADLAEARSTSRSKAYLKRQGYWVAAMDSLHCRGSKEVLDLIKKAYSPVAAVMMQKGRRVRPVRVMVVGVPNVGKSSFINCLAGRKIARVGEKPGITRGRQWLRIREDIELMDTPGLMWPKIEDEKQGLKLALLNIIGENAYQEYDVARYLVEVLKQGHPDVLRERYRVQNVDLPEEEILAAIATARGLLSKGGQIDLDKVSRLVLQEYRRGAMGSISLE
ncbi:MAG: ribosome biogenesis GTPase YlqF [Syntrophomonadaceae bacterium]|jgi:ribosome biogenesis GTPase A|nr:ribosome biogenesis GTPase YlqF [Syntrophomonadaceae bacterium]